MRRGPRCCTCRQTDGFFKFNAEDLVWLVSGVVLAALLAIAATAQIEVRPDRQRLECGCILRVNPKEKHNETRYNFSAAGSWLHQLVHRGSKRSRLRSRCGPGRLCHLGRCRSQAGRCRHAGEGCRRWAERRSRYPPLTYRGSNGGGSNWAMPAVRKRPLDNGERGHGQIRYHPNEHCDQAAAEQVLKWVLAARCILQKSGSGDLRPFNY